MDNKVSVDGLTFVPYLTSAEIDREVKRVASELREDLKGKNPLFLCVLNGAFIFAADLFREVGLNNARINFVKYSSYEGTSSTGKVKEIMGLTEDIEGMDVVIVEDIVDTGLTASMMVSDLKKRNPRSIRGIVRVEGDPEDPETGIDSGFKIYANQRRGRDSLTLIAAGNDRRFTVTALFDNLGKGASGAAVQNMNIMLCLPEETGLVS